MTDPLTLDEALDAWRACRHPDLSALVRRLSEPHARGFSITSWQGWFEHARRDATPAGTARLAWLLDAKLALGSMNPPTVEASVASLYKDLFGRVEVLRERCPDPRVAEAALRVVRGGELRAGFWGAAGTPHVYGPLVELLVAAGDPSVADEVEALAQRPLSRHGPVREALAALLPSAVERLRAIPVSPIPPEIAARLPRRGPRPSATPAELWRELVEHPDEELVAVLGDAWIEAGDPRGEIVSLERAKADAKTVRRAYAACRELWLGPDLGATLLEPRGRGGVLHEATLVTSRLAGRSTWAAAAEDERLATLQVLRRGSARLDIYAGFVCSPLARSLRVAEAETDELLDQLGARPLPTLQVLERLDGDAVVRRLSSPGLASVHTLSFRGPADLMGLADALRWAGVAGRIRAIAADEARTVGGASIEPALRGFAELRDLLPGLERVSGMLADVHVTLQRHDGEWEAVLAPLGRSTPRVPIPAEVGQVRMVGADYTARAAVSAACIRLPG